MKVEQKSMLGDLCHALKILLLEEKYKSLALLRSIIMMKWNMKVIINDYHKRANKKQLESVVYWWKCQMSLQEVLESVQAVAGTMTCKGVQIHVPRMILCQYCKDEGVDVHVRFAGKLQVEPHELRSIS